MSGSSGNPDTCVLSGARSKTELTLWFVHAKPIELTKTLFRSPLLDAEVSAVRGKTAGAFRTQATFQWTPGVQGLAVLLLRASAFAKLGRQEAFLEGPQGSLACSLDSSIYKQTAWLDLFGSNSKGDSLAKRILHRSNPGLRRCGPVTISLNEKALPPPAIRVYLDNKPLNDAAAMLRYADGIETGWNQHHAPITQMGQLELFNPLKI